MVFPERYITDSLAYWRMRRHQSRDSLVKTDKGIVEKHLGGQDGVFLRERSHIQKVLSWNEFEICNSQYIFSINQLALGLSKASRQLKKLEILTRFLDGKRGSDRGS
jgi:hypothetical protein